VRSAGFPMNKRVQRLFKKIIDRFFAGLFLIVLSPFLLIISVLIKKEDGASIFFRQERLGKNGNVFNILKFRTMIPDAVHKGSGIHIEANDYRITKIGAFLRNKSLDELPQLVNIIKGEMSFIGPRPPLTFYPKRYEDYEKWVLERFTVLPGITGLAQVRGRNDIDWYERFKYDIEYVRNWSLKMDLQIIFKTVFTVLSGKGIYKHQE
jgi:lipopolysaccharide/colanic/teichoic acid biosynthesis glycosyltransferase